MTRIVINNLNDLKDVTRFVDAHFVGHTPEAQNGKVAFINHLQSMAKNRKRFVHTPVQTIAMGDVVLVHSKQVDRDVENDLGTGYIDIFRFNNQGQIVEQWNVKQKVKPVDERYNINEIFAYPYRWSCSFILFIYKPELDVTLR
ncbi:SnoaL-like domain-containing protein [Vibrio sp. S9_S30]|uniref:nuclear transport factor 2 family protein n=1 Tax=Vibrio sp. S9_S30 TaxID=2720226 RepID=UPI0016807B9A|nr:nuclear transport factor 2 family protein [Vibrio sp. S9_S30]MBD1557129.1 SnoaL-like domain-containing protein [Vibrio sp. S9_S30]